MLLPVELIVQLCREEEERERERTAAAAVHHCRRDHPHHCSHHRTHCPTPAGSPSGSVSLASLPTAPHTSPLASSPLTAALGGEPPKRTTTGLLRSARESFIGRRQQQQQQQHRNVAGEGASSNSSTIASPAPTVTSPLLAKAKERCKLFSMQRQQYQHCHSQSIEMDVYDTEAPTVERPSQFV
uniref:Uncharacterized protein n=1 Tax=Anopheles epiroticus TaxID=199890 RepID=A0A182P3R8_9DIPT